MFKIICIVLLTFNLYACDTSEYVKIMQKYNLDVHIKSTKGWIRILENEDKLKCMNIIMSNSDRMAILDCMYYIHNTNKVGVLR